MLKMSLTKSGEMGRILTNSKLQHNNRWSDKNLTPYISRIVFVKGLDRKKLHNLRKLEQTMDINPLIADLNKYKDELIDSIKIAIGFNELQNADRYVAHDMAEIKGQLHSSDPFQQVANLYNLPREEVLENIRTFTNKEVKTLMPGDPKLIKDIKFKPNGEE